MASGVGEPVLEQTAGRPVSYLRIYTDSDGITRFEDLDQPTTSVDFAPPAPPVFATAPQAASTTLFLALPQGWTGPAHPSPARQLALFLSGDAIGTAGDEERRVGPGSIVLMEDTTGPGHRLTALTDIVMAIVRLGPAG
jgi:quercetin dioxygenase-like cupin family protein